jgi:hypothetical protein
MPKVIKPVSIEDQVYKDAIKQGIKENRKWSNMVETALKKYLYD